MAQERLQHVAEIQRSHCPAVMVLAAESVQQACHANGLTLAELLRPFGVIRQLNGTVGGECDRASRAAAAAAATPVPAALRCAPRRCLKLGRRVVLQCR